jgi:hypothetical protein
MSDFAPWLRNLTIEDPELVRLQEFVDAHSREWPYYSNKLSDFFRIVVLARDRNEVQLLETLERYYMLWKGSVRAEGTTGFWSNFGPLALFLVGMIVTLFLMYQIYAPSLATAIAEPNHSNALITFLFAFAATSAIVAAAIGILWFDRADISSGFAKAKDISTVLAGVIGTILVFYFVSPAGAPPARDPPVSAAPGAAALLAPVPPTAAPAASAAPAVSGGSGIPLEPAESGTATAAAPAPDAPVATAPTTLSGDRPAGAEPTAQDRPTAAGLPVPPLPMAAVAARHRGRP